MLVLSRKKTNVMIFNFEKYIMSCFMMYEQKKMFVSEMVFGQVFSNFETEIGFGSLKTILWGSG